MMREDEIKFELFIDPLSSNTEDAVLKQISYSREQLQLDLVHLREWLSAQTYLPPSRLIESDNFLKMYLTGCKGKMDIAKKKLISYYSFRSRSEIFKCRDPLAADYLASKNVLYFGMSYKVDKENLYRVSSSRFNCSDPKDFNFLNCLRKLMNLIELRLRLESISVSNHVIIDLNGVGAGHMFKLSPTLIRDVIRLGQEIFPFRFASICFINAPLFIGMAANNLILPFLRRKLQERIYVFSKGKMEELYKIVDKNRLPIDFGGEDRPIKEAHDLWNEFEVERREWFLNELSETCTEVPP